MKNEENEQTVEVDGADNAAACEEDGTPRPLDGGWGWMVVLGSAINHIVFGVIVRAFGVIYIELLDRYKASATATAWIGAINMALAGLLSPIVSILCVRFTCRPVALFGGVAIAVGVVSTAFAPNLAVTYVTFGFITGIGLAHAYTPGIILVGDYFEKRKALAMSLATFATGIGAMFPPLMLYLFEKYGFEGAMLIIGGVTLHCCIGALLFRPLKDNFLKRKSLEPVKESLSKRAMPKILQASMESLHSPKSFREREDAVSLTATEDKNLDSDMAKIEAIKHPKKTITFKDDVSEENTGDGNKYRPMKERKESIFHKPNPKQKICDLSLLKDYRFMSLSYVIFCNSLNLGLVSAFVPVLAIDRGISVPKAVSLLTLSGIASTVGVLILGPLNDTKWVKPQRIHLFNLSVFVVGLTALFNPLAYSYAGFVMVSSVRGALAGHVQSQRATIVADIVGRAKLNLAVGMVLFSTSLGLLVGRAIGGVVKDTTGAYDLAFYIAGAVTLMGATVFQGTECWHSRTERRRERNARAIAEDTQTFVTS